MMLAAVQMERRYQAEASASHPRRTRAAMFEARQEAIRLPFSVWVLTIAHEISLYCPIGKGKTSAQMKRRVVITGIGAVSPNGIGREAFWEASRNGVSGVRRITRFDPCS